LGYSQKQLIKHAYENAIITTLIDFYGIEDKHDFPKWTNSKQIIDKNRRMDFLENAMREDFDDRIRYKIYPYLQLHEFEGLLFNNIEVFENQLDETDFIDKEELIEIINKHPNPELINDNPLSAPSKRLMNLIEGYNKIVYGNILAEAIGLKRIREKAPRFDNWIKQLIKSTDLLK